MDSTPAPSTISDEPRLAALADAPAPALLVGGEGEIVWANAAAGALRLGERLDPASARAAVGAEGLLRLRLGGAGRFAPIALRAEPLAIGDRAFTLLAALAPLARSPWSVPAPAPVVKGQEPLAESAPDDVVEAVAEPAAIASDAEAAPEALSAPFDDPPPDPRVDPPSPAPEAVPPAIEPAAAATPARDLRFVFELDADDRLSFLSPDLGEAVGDSAAAAIGWSWRALADDLALDPEGAVAEAIAARRPWRDLPVSWPMAAGGRLALTLSALPVFDRGRTFAGFRGLGISVEPVTEPASAEETSPAAEAPPPEAVPSSAAEEPSPAPASAELPVAADAATEEPPAELPLADLSAAEPSPVEEPAEDAEGFSDNVVPLRDTQVMPPRAGLSSHEASAFDEIARRLREPATAPSPRDIWEDIAADAELPLGPGGDAQTTPAAADLLRLLDRMPLGALVLRGDDALYANRAALDMTGHADVAELAARGAGALFAEPLSHDEAAPGSIRLVAKDGAEIDVGAKLSATMWGDAPATVVLLRRGEGGAAALATARQRENELSAILDTATDGVLTLDSAGRVLSINRSAEALLGYEARELVGSLFSLALAPESRRVAFEYLDGLRANPVASLLNDGREVLGLVRQGGAIPLYLTLGRVGRPEDGRFCAVLRDITHWKKAEEELIAAKRQAERANAQKSDFLAKVSHEIRTPLNAIIGFAEVMMEERFGAVGNERYKEYLRDIHLSGGHLISLVNDLLDLSKIEAGKLELDFADVDLNEAATQAVALLQPQANREHIIIRTSLARSLPRVRADQRSIRQIVLNLASNAVKFTPAGGQVIVATALNDLGEPVIRVRDTGVGMSRKEQALALEPFRQLPVSGREGAGLGLPLTKALAEANNAVFSLQSAVGEGTLVEVTFSSLTRAAS
ncbi:histidine kinase dimerization/phospho-acceptor domain-containing protein [Methylopila henanensis]|uniref:histidine kinase n=1 Tax=Methylopila henanensis TaxID=873516 RepID=A0ABW4KAD9_9HYPH